MKISQTDLYDWTSKLIAASGCHEKIAREAAWVFVEASLSNVGHHDISYLPQRLEWLASKKVNGSPRWKKVEGKRSFEVFDANNGLGEWAVLQASKRAVKKALWYGTAMVSVRHSNHFLAASPYIHYATKKNCALLIWSNTDKTMRYPGSREAIIGNNPYAMGFPSKSHIPLLDICMAYASLGTLRAYEQRGEKVPLNWGVDEAGRPSSSPREILQGGSISPMGEHKGFGLAYMTELITGGLAGGEMLDEITSPFGIGNHTQTILAIHIPENKKAHLDKLADQLHTLSPQARYPGERSGQERASSLKQGIELSLELYENLCNWSQKLSVDAYKL